MLKIDGKDIPISLIKDYLNKEKYTIKTRNTSSPHITIINAIKDDHKIVINQYDYLKLPNFSAKLMTKTPLGKWAVARRNDDIKILIGWWKDQKNKVKYENLPEPERFYHEIVETDGNWSKYTGFISKATVTDAVAIEGVGTISSAAVYDSQKRGWFLVKIITYKHSVSAVKSVITDGEEWYPIKLIKEKYQIVKEGQHGYALNTVDQTIIQHAIREYVEDSKMQSMR